MELKRRQQRELTPKQGKYITGLSEGKSRRQAALDAGYSQACADNPRYTIESAPVRKELGRIIRRYVDPNKIGQRISEGLSATKTRFFQHQGVITDLYRPRMESIGMDGSASDPPRGRQLICRAATAGP